MSIPSSEVMLHGVNTFRSFVNFVKTSSVILSDKEMATSTKVCLIAARSLGIASSIYETDAIIHNLSAKDLLLVESNCLLEKTVEFTLDLSALILETKNENEKNSLERIRFVITNLMTSMVDTFRLSGDCFICEERQYLEMSPEEIANGKRIYIDGEGNVFEKPIDIEESKKMIQFFEEMSVLATASSVTLEQANEKIFPIRQNVNIQPLQPRPARVPAIPRQPITVNDEIFPRLAELREQYKQQNVSDVLSLSIIPVFFYENDPDSIFKKFECCIGRVPARYPVQDPTAKGERKVIYDEINILEHLQQLKKQRRPLVSPLTQKPLSPDDLIPMRAAQRLIDSKLRSFQEKWSTILAENPELNGLGNDPQRAALIAAARSEIGEQLFDEVENSI